MEYEIIDGSKKPDKCTLILNKYLDSLPSRDFLIYINWTFWSENLKNESIYNIKYFYKIIQYKIFLIFSFA